MSPIPGFGLWGNGFRVNLRESHLARKRDSIWSLLYRSWHKLGPSPGSEGLWEIPDVGMLRKLHPQMSHHVSHTGNTGCCVVADSSTDAFGLAEDPDEQNGGCPTHATGGLPRQWTSLPHLLPDLTMKSSPCRLQELAETILLSTVDLITLFYFVVTCWHLRTTQNTWPSD